MAIDISLPRTCILVRVFSKGMALICDLVAESCCVYQPTEKNNLSIVNITENQQTFTETPADLKSQGNLIFFQGQGIVREF